MFWTGRVLLHQVYKIAHQGTGLQGKNLKKLRCQEELSNPISQVRSYAFSTLLAANMCIEARQCWLWPSCPLPGLL